MNVPTDNSWQRRFPIEQISAPISGMITSTIHVLILVPVFFVMMKERALKHGTLAAINTAE